MPTTKPYRRWGYGIDTKGTRRRVYQADETGAVQCQACGRPLLQSELFTIQKLRWYSDKPEPACRSCRPVELER